MYIFFIHVVRFVCEERFSKDGTVYGRVRDLKKNQTTTNQQHSVVLYTNE